MKLQQRLQRTSLIALLLISSFSWALSKPPKAYVISPKLTPELTEFYLKHGFKYRRSIPNVSSQDRLIVYGCRIEKSISHLEVLYICIEPDEPLISEHAFLIPVPSPTDQLNLARLLIKEHLNIAVIYSKKSELQFEYLATNKQDGIEISGYRSYGSLTFDTDIKNMIKSSDAVLALEDDRIFNASTLRALILNTYRQGKPVFGPNEQFVESGSVASLCLSELHVAQAAVKLAQSFDREYLPGIYFPSVPDVKTNRFAAKAFSMNLPSEGQLIHHLQQISLREALNEI